MTRGYDDEVARNKVVQLVRTLRTKSTSTSVEYSFNSSKTWSMLRSLTSLIIISVRTTCAKEIEKCDRLGEIVPD